MKQTKKKMTNKDVMAAIAHCMDNIQSLHMSLVNSDKALNEYIEYKKDAKPFMEHLKAKFNIDDTDTEKTEDK